MARPASDDPKVPITLRLPTSAMAELDARAARKKMPTRRYLEEQLLSALSAPRPIVVRSNERPRVVNVEPNFKKGTK